MYKGYLIDLDGVAYLGKNVITTCLTFIKKLKQEHIKFCFVTNNSTRTHEELILHLTRLGYDVTEENIITSSDVTANYIKSERTHAKVFLIGMNGIREELIKNEMILVDEHADYVVVGLDVHITYQKLINATQEILNGARFISTNSDLRLLTNEGVTPGNGAITKAIEAVTNVAPIYMGKPQEAMFTFALNKMNLKKHEVAMIGDNYYTDIVGAHQFGIDSIFVETGVMTIEELNALPIKPTHILKDLSYFKL